MALLAPQSKKLDTDFHHVLQVDSKLRNLHLVSLHVSDCTHPRLEFPYHEDERPRVVGHRYLLFFALGHCSVDTV